MLVSIQRFCKYNGFEKDSSIMCLTPENIFPNRYWSHVKVAINTNGPEFVNSIEINIPWG